MQTFLRAASSPNLFDDASVLDSVITTESWQTLMTFTREMAREFRHHLTMCGPFSSLKSSCTAIYLRTSVAGARGAHGRGYPTRAVRTVR